MPRRGGGRSGDGSPRRLPADRYDADVHGPRRRPRPGMSHGRWGSGEAFPVIRAPVAHQPWSGGATEPRSGPQYRRTGRPDSLTGHTAPRSQLVNSSQNYSPTSSRERRLLVSEGDLNSGMANVRCCPLVSVVDSFSCSETVSGDWLCRLVMSDISQFRPVRGQIADKRHPGHEWPAANGTASVGVRWRAREQHDRTLRERAEVGRLSHSLEHGSFLTGEVRLFAIRRAEQACE